jgi:hypothetical protein
MSTATHGGIYLKHTDDGSHQWFFQATHQKENLDLSMTPTHTTIETRTFTPEVWTRISMYYYIDPPGTSAIEYWINDEPHVLWLGKQGAEDNPQLGDIGPQTMDAKLAVYAKPYRS